MTGQNRVGIGLDRGCALKWMMDLCFELLASRLKLRLQPLETLFLGALRFLLCLHSHPHCCQFWQRRESAVMVDELRYFTGSV